MESTIGRTSLNQLKRHNNSHHKQILWPSTTSTASKPNAITITTKQLTDSMVKKEEEENDEIKRDESMFTPFGVAKRNNELRRNCEHHGKRS